MDAGSLRAWCWRPRHCRFGDRYDVGAWEATSARGAALTFVGLIEEEDFAGSVIIRATVEVDATGATFSGPYSYTFVASDGTVVDRGRDMVRGTRITVEPVEAEGTPAAAVPTWMPEAAMSGTPRPSNHVRRDHRGPEPKPGAGVAGVPCLT